MKHKKNRGNVGKLILSIFFIAVFLLTNVGAAFANELPEEGTAKARSVVTVLGKNMTYRTLLAEDGTHYTAFCLKSDAAAPSGNVYKEVGIDSLKVNYYEEVLKTLLNYPIIGNEKDFPVVNNEYFSEKYTADARDYYIRQSWVWAYQRKVEGILYVWGTHTGEDEKFSKEIRAVYNKIVDGEITLPAENSIKVTTPDSDALEYNEATNCYETNTYKAESVGVLTDNITVENMDVPLYMNIKSVDNSNTDDGTVAVRGGSNIAVGDSVEEFYGSITKDEFDKLPVKDEKVNVSAKIGLMSTYTKSDYKLYVNKSGGNTQDLGVIVKEQQWTRKDAEVKATASVPKEKEEDTGKQEVDQKDNNNNNNSDNNTTQQDKESGQGGSSKTGDNNNLGLWLAIMGVSVIGAGVLIKKKIKA